MRMVQSTFTKQKRELAKAASWIEKMRGQEVHEITFSPDGEKLMTEKTSYVDFTPKQIFQKVMDIIKTVVSQHGSRQIANSKNTGRFSWNGIEVELTVPQLRTLQEAQRVLNDLFLNLPRRNPRLVPNTTVDDFPAFAYREQKHFNAKTRYVPYEEDSTTRVRTYEERYEEHTHTTQKVEVDYGLDISILKNLNDQLADFNTAIQIAIDEANCKGRQQDPVLDKLIEEVCLIFNGFLEAK